MADIPTTEPKQIRAGDTVKWDRNDLSGNYPATSWTLTYTLINGTVKETITAGANGSNFHVNVEDAVSQTTPQVITNGLPRSLTDRTSTPLTKALWRSCQT